VRKTSATSEKLWRECGGREKNHSNDTPFRSGRKGKAHYQVIVKLEHYLILKVLDVLN